MAKPISSKGHPELTAWLAEHIRRENLSQRQLAERAGIVHSSVNRAMDPQGSVSFDVCHRIATALREHPVMLFELAGLVPRSHPNTDAERQVVHLFKQLDDAQRKQLLDYMRFLLQK